jgi:hypothetical protein
MRKLMMLGSMIFAMLLLSQAVLAAGVPKIGSSCPTGYHPDSSSGYCLPVPGRPVVKVVEQLGPVCPMGYRTDGSSGYCVPLDNFPQKNLVPKQGNSCPPNYHPDGNSGYCVSAF